MNAKDFKGIFFWLTTQRCFVGMLLSLFWEEINNRTEIDVQDQFRAIYKMYLDHFVAELEQRGVGCFAILINVDRFIIRTQLQLRNHLAWSFSILQLWRWFFFEFLQKEIIICINTWFIIFFVFIWFLQEVFLKVLIERNLLFHFTWKTWNVVNDFHFFLFLVFSYVFDSFWSILNGNHFGVIVELDANNPAGEKVAKTVLGRIVYPFIYES